MAVFRIAATYVGTVVGAGFASGQEILRFFAAYGEEGYWGIALATLLFAILGLSAMELGRQLGTDSYAGLVAHLFGDRLGRLMDPVVTLFLASSVTVMVSGSGAVFEQQFGIDSIWGAGFLVVVSALTVQRGLRGISAANTLIVPAMVALVLVLTAVSVNSHGLDRDFLARSWPELQAAPGWVSSALLYVSYNLVLALAVLVPLGRQAGRTSDLILGSILGGLILGLLAMATTTTLALHPEQATRVELPMLYAAGHLAPVFRTAYVVLLWSEIYSTAISGLFGLAVRARQFWGLNAPVTVWAMSLAALIASFSGFGPLVGLLYPLFGYLGLGVMGALAWDFVKRRLSPGNDPRR